MALFKIFKGSDSAKITDSTVSGYRVPTDGYAYYDTSTKLFYIDADYDGNGTIKRYPINAASAWSDSLGNVIKDTYITDVSWDSTNGKLTKELAGVTTQVFKINTASIGSASGWSAGSAPSLTTTTYTVPNVTNVGTLPSLSMSVTDEVLSFSFGTGSLPTLGTAFSIKGVNSFDTGSLPSLTINNNTVVTGMTV